MKQSLGLLEVSGLALAISCADAMAKAASITLVGLEKTNGSGWTLIKITGDVASVNAAIATGASFAGQRNGLVAHKVIARPGDGILPHTTKALTVTVETSETPATTVISEIISCNLCLDPACQRQKARGVTVDKQTLQETVSQILDEMRERPIPLGVSSRHIHLSTADYLRLFPEQPISEKTLLMQPGQFAAEQVVTLEGPKGKLHNVRLLGPLRNASQVEISRTDARTLGITAPLRMSGDLSGTPGIRLISPFAELEITSGVIVAQRHIHMSPLDALIYGVTHGDKVAVAIKGDERRLIFENVAVRVSPDMRLEMHIDTDEANAAGADSPDVFATLVSVP